jgi:signal transduction histidine kinase
MSDDESSRWPLVTAPFQRRTWAETLHLVLDLPIGVIFGSLAITYFWAGVGLTATLMGLPLLVATLLACRGVGGMERARARKLLGLKIGNPARFTPRRRGFLGWLTSGLRDAPSWRALLYFFLLIPVGALNFALAVSMWATAFGGMTYPYWYRWLPADHGHHGGTFGDQVYTDTPGWLAVHFGTGVLFLFLAPWVVRGMAQLDGAMVRGLLGATTLSERVRHLEETRGKAVDTSAAHLRRIERDLHDGAQARLVAVAMELGRVKQQLTKDPARAAEMIDSAHREAKEALVELRNLARGIYPAVLTDRGLEGALPSLAARCPVPVAVSLDIPRRPNAAVEATAYFCAAELLTNVAKHAQAQSASLRVRETADWMILDVSDDGVGGAGIHDGGGLSGLADRADSVDGRIVVDSPAGGPTTIRVELPCGS